MNETTKIVLGFFGGLAVGGVTGFFVTKSVLKRKYDHILQDEIDAFKEEYVAKRLRDKVDYPTAESFLEDMERQRAANNLVEELGYVGPDFDEEQPPESRLEVAASMVEAARRDAEEPMEPHIQNVFDSGLSPKEIIAEYSADPDGLSYSDFKRLKMEELRDERSNSSGEAYVIDKEEYEKECPSYERLSLRFFDGCGTVIDSNSRPLVDGEIPQLLGDGLDHFGIGSGDENVVYVRNPREGIEVHFDILKLDGTYEEFVLGARPSPREMKFREDD